MEKITPPTSAAEMYKNEVLAMFKFKSLKHDKLDLEFDKDRGYRTRNSKFITWLWVSVVPF